MYTIGHGTLPAGAFIELLRAPGVELLRDVRSVPKSRHNPQFAIEAIGTWLPTSGISYEWQRQLGGWRRPLPDSINLALRNAAFRGYADYMQTPLFAEALDELIAAGRDRGTAIMCSESVWWRCHRRLIADALTARAIEVHHLMHDGRITPHILTDGAAIANRTVTYPQGSPRLF